MYTPTKHILVKLVVNLSVSSVKPDANIFIILGVKIIPIIYIPVHITNNKFKKLVVNFIASSCPLLFFIMLYIGIYPELKPIPTKLNITVGIVSDIK